MEIQVLLVRNRYYKSVWKEKETKSPRLLYYLDKFDRYSNLFLGIVYQLRLSVNNKSLYRIPDAMQWVSQSRFLGILSWKCLPFLSSVSSISSFRLYEEGACFVLTRATKLSKTGKFPAMWWTNCHLSQFFILDNTPSSLINYELVVREILHSVRGWRFAAANTVFS